MADGQADIPAIPTGLALLRQPFEDHQISKLPKPTKRQTEIVRNDYKEGIRCKICGQWHHPDVIHLDYVGHAALTDRLLECDPYWNWEPLAFDDRGFPALDQNGGMWIRLTVCGHSRLGYGHPDGKKGGDAVKEIIGDALRNAAMRFGAALDLWHKGQLHLDNDNLEGADQITSPPKQEVKPQQSEKGKAAFSRAQAAIAKMEAVSDVDAFHEDEKRIAFINGLDPIWRDKIISALSTKRTELLEREQIEEDSESQSETVVHDEVPF